MDKTEQTKSGQDWHENLADLIDRKKTENEVLRKIRAKVNITNGPATGRSDNADGIDNDCPSVKS